MSTVIGIMSLKKEDCWVKEHFMGFFVAEESVVAFVHPNFEEAGGLEDCL